MADQRYIPALTTRVAEMRALRELAGPTKDLLYPLVRLQVWPNAGRLEVGIEKLHEALAGRPYAIDLATPRSDVGPRGEAATAQLSGLHNPAKGFDAWTEFVATATTGTPVIQWCDNPLAVAAQAKRLLSLGRGLVVRLRRSQTWNLAQLSSLGTIEFGSSPILVVLDYEQIGRFEDLTLAAVNVRGAALAARNALPASNLSFVLIASSWPSEFASIHPTHQKLEIRERALHALTSGSPELKKAGINLGYGDHAAVYAADKERGFGGAPRVDYPTSSTWTYHRRPKDVGFAVAAQAIMDEPEWDDSLLCWGAQEIRRAASGDITGLGALGPWTAIRVGIHLHQQAHAGGDASTPIDEPWSD